jgi:hypothetical protein
VASDERYRSARCRKTQDRPRSFWQHPFAEDYSADIFDRRTDSDCLRPSLQLV